MIYLLVIIFLLFLILRFDISTNKIDMRAHNKLLFVVFCLFVMIPSLSYRIGSDTIAYETWYSYELNPINRFSFNDSTWEPLFCLTMSILKTLNISWFWAHFIIIAFINYSIISFGKRYVRPIFTFLLFYFLLYFYEYNFEPLRQSIAMGIMLISVPLLEKKKYGRFYIYIILAIGFHHAAFTALFFPFLHRIKISSWLSIVVLMSMVVVGNYVNTNFYDVIRVITFENDYYMGYEGREAVTAIHSIFGILYRILTMILPVFFALKIHALRSHSLHKHFEGIMYLYMSFVMLASFLHIVDRFVLFFGAIQIAIYAGALFITNTKGKSSLYVSLMKVYILLSFVVSVYKYNFATNEFDFPNYRRYYPYTSVFDKQKDIERENKQLFRR